MARHGTLRAAALVCGGVVLGWLSGPLLRRVVRRTSTILTGEQPGIEPTELQPQPQPEEAPEEPQVPPAAPAPAARALALQRPLVTFDLETTGLDVASDRIVSFAAIKTHPDGSTEEMHRLINPGMPIPAGVIAVHGITNEHVAGRQTFEDIAFDMHGWFIGCDLHGFNCSKFDVPLLAAEFKRCGLVFPPPGAAVVDSFTIFVRKEPRNLTAALSFYCGMELVDAHSAAADTRATLDVLLGQIDRYHDLPLDVPALAAWCSRPANPDRDVDGAGKFIWQAGKAMFNFGKHKGRLLERVAAEDRVYLRWMLNGGFPEDVLAIATAALDGRFPIKPAAGQQQGAQAAAAGAEQGAQAAAAGAAAS